MKLWVGVTDQKWYEYLASISPDEVNFWKPGGQGFGAIEIGAPFLFKLLDWVCVTWDADFRYTKSGWENWSFKGHRWEKIKKLERQLYLKNAYRVLLTRARQGMIIVIPEGAEEDHTRQPKFYDSTYQYLKEMGFEEI